MERYDSYKDSGVEWIGEIPSGWGKSPIKYYYNYKKGSRGQELTKTYIQDNLGDYPVYSGQTENEGVLGRISDFEFDFPEGVIFTTTVGVKMMSTKVLRNKFSLSQNCLVMIPKKEVNSDFVNYFISVDWVFRKLQFPKILQPSLRMEDIDQYFFYYPPLSEQQQIVSFLDTKTLLIDSLIEKTQQKIELLKEKRTSLINEVVTKGLNPNVEMKDSGVEWIGEIPSHYQIGKLKHLCNENQRSLSNSTDPNYELNYIEISDVNSEGVIGNSTPYIFSESPSRCRRIVQKGDVIVSTVRTYLKSIGLIEEEVEDLICSTGFSVLTPNTEINSKYLFYLLRTEWFISMVISNSEGVSYPSIQSEKLMNIDVVFCEFSEQQQIVEYLDEQTRLIDNTTSIEEKRIELLKEYRQSLISEVVTGKRKVVE